MQSPSSWSVHATKGKGKTKGSSSKVVNVARIRLLTVCALADYVNVPTLFNSNPITEQQGWWQK
jgi:hypothetical protein